MPAHNGCVNTVFHMRSTTAEGYVRVTTRQDRSMADLMGEINFIRHLDAKGVSVATPYTSKDSQTVSMVEHMEQVFCYVIFRVAIGEQLSHRGYKYMEGVPLSKHHYNCGRILGQVHKASETYVLTDGHKRHHILDYAKVLMETYLPYDMIIVREKINTCMNQLEALEKNPKSYGMIHGDFGDGNYNIDYSNGQITLFDFDDCGYCWYMHEIASAWSASRGWVMYEQDLEQRKVLMDNIFASIVEGYRSVRPLEDTSIEQLPLYLKFVEIESFLDRLRYRSLIKGTIDFEDQELQEIIHCIENDILYFGLFEED